MWRMCKGTIVLKFLNPKQHKMHFASTLSAAHDMVDRMLARFQYEFHVPEAVTVQYRNAGTNFKKFLFFSINRSQSNNFRETISNVTLKDSSDGILSVSDINRIIIAFNDDNDPHLFVRMNIRNCPLLHYEELIEIETKAIIAFNAQEPKKISWNDFLESVTTKSAMYQTPEIYTLIDMDEHIYAPSIDSINLQNDTLCFEITRHVNNHTTNTFTLRFKASPNTQAKWDE